MQLWMPNLEGSLAVQFDTPCRSMKNDMTTESLLFNSLGLRKERGIGRESCRNF